MSVCLCVCLSVCKKTSVEHGDSKKKLIIIPKFVLTDAGVRIVRIRTDHPEPDFESNLKYTPHRSLLYLKKSTNSEFFKLEHYSVFRINVKETSE